MDNKDQPLPSVEKIPPRPGSGQAMTKPSGPPRPDRLSLPHTAEIPPRPSNHPIRPGEVPQPIIDTLKAPIASSASERSEEEPTGTQRMGRRGFLKLGLGAGLLAAAGALGVVARNSGGSNTDAEPSNPSVNPTKIPKAALANATSTSVVVESRPMATNTTVAVQAQTTPTTQVSPTIEAALAPSPVASKEVKVKEPREIPNDVLSKEELAKMNVKILNSPNWDLLVRKGAMEYSPTFQWVQNKDAEESKAVLEKHSAIVKKSMAGESITDEERKLLQRSSRINRYYPNRGVTFVMVDESMITEEAMTPEQRVIIPADVLRKIKMADGFEGGQLLYSPVGSDTKSVECFIFIATKPLWNNEKYTSEQSFPRAGTDVVLEEKQTNISLLDQYPLRARTTKGKNPNILVRHEDEHINSDHPVTDRNVYRGLESATQALDKGDDSEYYYVMVKKDSEGKPEEVIVGQDSNHNVSNIAA